MKLVHVPHINYYLLRHWGKWYVILPDGGLVKIDSWIEPLREVVEEEKDGDA